MSAETITAALPRTPEASPRPIDSNAGSIAQPPEASALLQRLEATSAGEGSSEEGSTPDQRQREQALAADLRSVTESKVIYPSLIPSLPAPLVPIREVPALEESIIESNLILDRIESERTEETTDEQFDTGVNQFESRSTPDTDPVATEADAAQPSSVPVAINTPARREDTPEESSDSTRPSAGTERVLQSVVLAQAQDKAPARSPDSESSGRIVSFSR